MRNIRTVLALVCLVLLGLLLWFYYEKSQAPIIIPKLQRSTSAGQSTSIVEKPTSGTPRDEETQLPGGPFVASDPRWKRVKELEKTDKQWEWKTPIEFYGKVIDEKDQPVSGAKIHFVWNDTSAAGSSAFDTISDSAGLFSLSGVQGKLLGVKLQKEGYYTSQDQNHFYFEYAAFWDANYYQPDSKNPAIFRLLKKSQAEPLVYRSGLYGFPNNGTPIYWNLKTGKRSRELMQDTDLIVRVLRSEPVNSRYDWSVAIEGINGTGLLESNEEFMFTAPAAGYQNKIEVRQEASASDWKSALQRKFYVTGQNGKFYARVEVEILPNYDAAGAALNVKTYLNPSGSRNLEYDPAQQANSR